MENTFSLVLCIAGVVGGALLAEYCLRDLGNQHRTLVTLNAIGAAAGILLCLIFAPMLVVLVVRLLTGQWQ